MNFEAGPDFDFGGDSFEPVELNEGVAFKVFGCDVTECPGYGIVDVAGEVEEAGHIFLRAAV
ncbi:unnamed protein product [marine sediment metagenome]|uniref:Uncharacterized protein n=1 Tax=marine sediment metagenome TaxID=412755 RepID=X1PXS4_9ZZZZ